MRPRRFRRGETVTGFQGDHPRVGFNEARGFPKEYWSQPDTPHNYRSRKSRVQSLDLLLDAARVQP